MLLIQLQRVQKGLVSVIACVMLYAVLFVGVTECVNQGQYRSLIGKKIHYAYLWAKRHPTYIIVPSIAVISIMYNVILINKNLKLIDQLREVEKELHGSHARVVQLERFIEEKFKPLNAVFSKVLK